MASGTITTIEVPNEAGTVAMSINDKGVIVGKYFDHSFVAHGFMCSADGVFTTFSFGDEPHDIVTCVINNKGEIAGSYLFSGGTLSTFIRATSGKIKIFDIENAIYTGARSINDDGDIAGYYVMNTINLGFIRKSDGSVITVDPNDSNFTQVTPINKKGSVAGFYRASDGTEPGFVRNKRGNITTIEIEGATSVFPEALNQKGVMTGIATAGSSNHGFVYTP